LLEDNGVRVFFDFGQSFTMGSGFFTGWLSPRSTNGLCDYFEFNLLPKLRGLYGKEHLQFANISYVKRTFDAVFLSHGHFDHVNHIRFLDPEIPVYLGVGTKLFLEAMEKTSSACNYGEHEFHKFRTGNKIRIGDVVVEPVHVDHSIPAAYGFLIHTSEGTIVYTGDLRIHGPRRDLTEEFAERALKSEPEVMICEGTRMIKEEKRKNYSEEQVKQLSSQVVSSTRKIVFVARYSRDMDRFRSFYNVAKENNRKIVVFPKTAYLLSKLVNDKRLDLPDPLNDEHMLVYYKRKKSGEFREKDYYMWERRFMDKMVTHKFVHDHQDSLIMDLDFYQFTELVDIRPDPNSHFIHSMSEPFSEEDIEDEVMHNWLDHFKMHFHQLHASGHMNKQQITNLINHVKPKKIFPIHTENQSLFKKISNNTQIIKRGKAYTI